MKSILQKEKRCFLCDRTVNLDEHHVFEGYRRSASERYGLKVYLCHDTCHLNGVHADRKKDLAVKRYAQSTAMQVYGWSVQEFISKFTKNYLED